MMFTQDRKEPAALALAACAEGVTERCIQRMLADPFWAERYGDLALKHAREEGQDSLAYLGEALRSDRAEVFTNYVLWLRDTACRRGMCTLHVQTSLKCLEDELRALGRPELDPAIALLRDARHMLTARPGAPEQVDRLCPEVTAALAAASGLSPRALWNGAGPVLCSYLADAVAGRRPQSFTEHVRWRLGFLARRGVPAAEMLRVLDVMEGIMQQTALPFRTRILDTIHDGRVVVMGAG